MTFKKLDFVSVENDFENLLKIAKADFEYYDRKTNFYYRLLDKISPIEDNLPDDEKTIERYYDLYDRVYDNYAWASSLRDQLEKYVLKLERLRDEMLFFYEYNWKGDSNMDRYELIQAYEEYCIDMLYEGREPVSFYKWLSDNT